MAFIALYGISRRLPVLTSCPAACQEPGSTHSIEGLVRPTSQDPAEGTYFSGDHGWTLRFVTVRLRQLSWTAYPEDQRPESVTSRVVSEGVCHEESPLSPRSMPMNSEAAYDDEVL